MYMRLAFAVAAHLEPDILLVDEVLAVGDLAFQKKCMTRMRTVAREGKTVLLVSHNMAAIQSLANSAILLAGGQAAARGTVSEVIAAYIRAMAEQSEDGSTTPGLFNLRQPKDRVWDSSSPFEMELDIGLPARAQTAQLWCLVRDTEGTLIVQTGVDHTSAAKGNANQSWTIHLRFPPLNLRPGLYQLQFRVFLHGLGIKNHFYSDPVALEVAGDKDGTLSNALLAPRVLWDVTSRPALVPSPPLVQHVKHA
jgi:lipopolysaccharide transport system ATP-binding protein